MGLFESLEQAEAGAMQLDRAGFCKGDVRVLRSRSSPAGAAILVSVHVETAAEEARATIILRRAGGQGVGTAGASPSLLHA
jgi:hypothetical protein